MIVQLHPEIEEFETIGTRTVVFGTFGKGPGADGQSASVGGGVGGKLTPEEFRVNELTRLVKETLRSEAWIRIIRKELSPLEESVVWQVVHTLLSSGSAQFSESENILLRRALKDGNYTAAADRIFGWDWFQMRDWCICAVQEVLEERMLRHQEISSASVTRIIMSVQMAARFCLQNKDVAHLPGVNE